MTYRPSQVEVRQYAAAVLTSAEETDPGLLARLEADPLSALATRADLRVVSVPEAASANGCSVAGAYFANRVPPALAVVSSASAGRRAFTALHEFIHHVQQTTPALADVLLQQPDLGDALEEATCDAAAAAILLPDRLVQADIGERGPTAAAVVSLWQASSASRAAVCVRAAQRLTSPGHVLLLRPDGDVEFAAAHGLPPVRRGSAQGRTPVIREALNASGRRARGQTRVRYRDGIAGAELHVQTADMGGYVVAVLVTDSAPWAQFSIPSRIVGPTSRWTICEHCGEESSSFDSPCARCGVRTCTDCGRCRCPSRVAERRCDSCFLVLPEAMYSGTSSRCIDCS